MPPLERDQRGSLISNTSPAVRLVSITPNDTVDLTAWYIRALWVGVGGTVVVQGLYDLAPNTLLNVADGALLPIMVRRVFLTGTTASNLVGFI